MTPANTPSTRTAPGRGGADGVAGDTSTIEEWDAMAVYGSMSMSTGVHPDTTGRGITYRGIVCSVDCCRWPERLVVRATDGAGLAACIHGVLLFKTW